MLLQYVPPVRCTVTILLSKGKLSLQSGLNEIPDERWEQIKDLPEIVAKVKDGIIVLQGTESATALKVNANTATVRQLEQLPGIGKAIADRIVSARPHSDLFSVKTATGMTDKEWSKVEALVEV